MPTVAEVGTPGLKKTSAVSSWPDESLPPMMTTSPLERSTAAWYWRAPTMFARFPNVPVDAL
jgi:hypothetical protein